MFSSVIRQREYGKIEGPAVLQHPGPRHHGMESAMRVNPTTAPDSKACLKCGVVKPLDDFARRYKGRPERSSACKSCDAAYLADRSVQIAERKKLYREAHREEIAAYRAAHRQSHEADLKAKKAAYYLSHRDQSRAQKAAWERAHPAERAEQIRAYNKAHPDKRRQRSMKRRALIVGAKVLGPVMLEEIRQRDQGKCWLCEKVVSKKEQSFDHAVALTKGGEHSTRNIRLAHLSCNLKKQANDITHQRYLL